MTKVKGTVSAPVFCRMPGSHRPAMKIVCDYDGIQTSLYLTAADIGGLHYQYNRGQLPQVGKPAGKPRRRHV